MISLKKHMSKLENIKIIYETVIEINDCGSCMLTNVNSLRDHLQILLLIF